MANTKISALPASTTPLAGTEVLPIVQGGSTVKVAVSNLTAGRSVSATAYTATNGGFTSNTGGAYTSNSATESDTISNLFYAQNAAGNKAVNFQLSSTNLGSVWAYNGSSWLEGWAIATNGDLRLPSNNIVIGTSGKGIDFSATPSTGTSELLNDYEEGAWTPALSDGTNSSSFPANSGWYTKVGNLVTVGFNAYNLDVTGLSATTSPLRITGLPFTSGSKAAYNASALPINLTGENIFLFLGSAATSIFINRATGTVDSTSLTRAGAGSPNNMSVYGQILYNV